MTQSTKQLSINAFFSNSPGQNWIGMWSAPGSQALRYTDIDYWIEIAKIAERGLFDSIFFADTNGVFDVYGGSPRASIERAAMFPINDPLLLIPTMAHATRHVGFGVTSNLTFEQPYLLARRFSTLDHLTKGRVSWNVVTGFQDSAARAMGMETNIPHDERYDLADEYMEVVYKLWEGSWEDGSVVRDRQRRLFANGDKVHEVTHEGKHFKMRGVHLCEPSPQRTPVIYQAGGSARGRAFAARHAECIFMSGLPKAQTRERVREIRERARAEGRDPSLIKFVMMATIVTGKTDAEAKDRYEMLSRCVDAEGMLALYSGFSGMDVSKELGQRTGNNGMEGVVEYLLKEDKSLERLRKIVTFGPQAGRECFLVGSPVRIADELQSWAEEADIDGFNLHRSGEPQHLTDFVDLVVPELQNRKAYRQAYSDGTFRQKLFGKGDRIDAGHPAARYRIPASD